MCVCKGIHERTALKTQSLSAVYSSLMSRSEFLRSLDEILELGPGTLKGPEPLAEFPFWDSTAVMSFIALVDTHNGSRLAARDISRCDTVDDLLALAKVDA